jgi:septal ring factor EnvC (AmiA/AmiB activator)
MGKVVTKFGTREMVGEARGIRIESRPGAQVVAPYDGKIVFAGPFRHYGQLLIIEHGDGYHSLLAGFGQLYGSIGQWVLTGEPVGVMTAKKSANQLYLELRSEGRAINPEPWLARRMASRN